METTRQWYFEDDGYGIVGWSFWCDHCSLHTRFASPPENEMICEHCGETVILTDKDIMEIEHSL